MVVNGLNWFSFLTESYILGTTISSGELYFPYYHQAVLVLLSLADEFTQL